MRYSGDPQKLKVTGLTHGKKYVFPFLSSLGKVQKTGHAFSHVLI